MKKQKSVKKKAKKTQKNKGSKNQTILESISLIGLTVSFFIFCFALIKRETSSSFFSFIALIIFSICYGYSIRKYKK